MRTSPQGVTRRSPITPKVERSTSRTADHIDDRVVVVLMIADVCVVAVNLSSRMLSRYRVCHC
jgi:hypothetical protein